MDEPYSHIIFAIDLGPQSLYIAHHAVNLSKICQAKLYALHIIEPPITYLTHFSEQESALQKSKNIANQSLNALCEQVGISIENRILTVGNPQEEILEISRKQQCDLIIVGSHGIGGYTHALGSTTHHLLEQSDCDVLIIQVKHLQKEIEEQASKDKYLWQLKSSLSLPSSQSKRQYGSEKGFGEVVRRGPHPSLHPSAIPYKGGTRTRTSEDEEQPKEPDDR